MKKFLIVGLVIVIVFAITISILFSSSYAPLKEEFNQTVQRHFQQTNEANERFRNEDIEGLPEAIQTYFRTSKFLGREKSQMMYIDFEQVDFLLNKDQPVSIEYCQYNAALKPNRVAWINTTVNGLPFQGFDKFVDGEGSMHGVVGKVITAFNETGTAYYQASLVTYLAESLILPNAALQNYIQWEEADSLSVKATINYYGLSASGFIYV